MVSFTAYQLFQANLENPNIRLFSEVDKQTIWEWRSANPDAIEDINEELNNPNPAVCRKRLCENSAAADIILDIYEKNCHSKYLYWKYLSSNTDPRIVALVEKRVEDEKRGMKSRNVNYNVCRNRLSANPSAFDLLMRHSYLIEWHSLIKNPSAILMIRKEYYNPTGKVEKWEQVCTNPAAWDIIIDLFYNNPHLINFDYFGSNPMAERLIREQMNIDKERAKKGFLARVSMSVVAEHINMLDVVEERAAEDPNSVYWNQLCAYNYRTPFNTVMYSMEPIVDVVDLLKSYNAFMDANNSVREMKEIMFIQNFEKNIYPAVCKAYNVIPEKNKPDNLIPFIRSRPFKVGRLLGPEPLKAFIEMKVERNLYAHSAKFWKESEWKDSKTVLGQYRMVKTVEFIRSKLIGEFKSLSTFVGNDELFDMMYRYPCRVRRLVAENPVELEAINSLDPIQSYSDLMKQRNELVHLV